MSDPTLADELTPIISSLVANGIPLQLAMRQIERKYIDVALTMNDGNITQTARKLGVHRNTLMNKRPSETALKMRARQLTRLMPARRRRTR